MPYRSSKLTRLLSNCLGGNACTCLCVCVSPAAFDAEETLSTLRFGSAAATITNEAVVNKLAGGAEELFDQLVAAQRQKAQNQQRLARLQGSVDELTDFLAEDSGLDLSAIEAVRFGFGLPGSELGRLGFDSLVLYEEE